LKINSLFFNFILSLVFLGIFAFSGNTFFDVGTDTYFKNVCCGTFLSTAQAIPLTFGCQTLYSQLSAVLANNFHSILWYDLFEFIFSILSCSLLIKVFYEVLSLYYPSPPKAYLYSIVIAFLLFYECSRLIEFTRVSSCGCLCVLLFLLLKGQSKISLLVSYILLAAFMLIRYETFPLVLLLILPVIFLTQQTLIRSFAILAIPFVLFIIYTVFFNYPLNNEAKAYLQFRKYQFTLIDYNTSTTSGFANMNDSLSIAVARQAFWNDPEILNSNLYSHYLPSMDKNSQSAINYLQNTDYTWQSLRLKIKKLDWRYCILILLPLFFIGQTIFFGRAAFFKILIVTGYYGLLLFLITLFLKIEPRILFSFFICYTLVSIYTLIKCRAFTAYTLISTGIIFLCFDILVSGKVNQLRNVDSEITRFAMQLKDSKNIENKLLLFDLQTFTRTGMRLFERPQFDGLRTFSLDNGILFMYEGYEKDCSKYFGTANTPQIMKKIGAANNNYLWIGALPRTKMIVDYFRTVHQIPLQYKTLSKLSAPEMENELPVVTQFSLQ
jgi:hypothetical protein